MSSIRTLALSAVVAMGTAASSLGQANPPVSNTVSNVNCGGGSGDLQRAIDNAPAGGTVVVRGACDKGPYYLRKNLRLTGFRGETVLSGGGDRVVDVIGANVRIERLTVDATQNSFGILIEEGSSGILDQVTVRNSQGAGVQAMLASYAGITSSSFINNLYGIFVAGSSNIWLDDNTLDGNQYAHIAAFANSSAFVYNSRLTNGNIGVLIERMSTGDCRETSSTGTRVPVCSCPAASRRHRLEATRSSRTDPTCAATCERC